MYRSAVAGKTRSRRISMGGKEWEEGAGGVRGKGRRRERRR
jgi:hypothetical protein